MHNRDNATKTRIVLDASHDAALAALTCFSCWVLYSKGATGIGYYALIVSCAFVGSLIYRAFSSGLDAKANGFDRVWFAPSQKSTSVILDPVKGRSPDDIILFINAARGEALDPADDAVVRRILEEQAPADLRKLVDLCSAGGVFL